MKIIEVSEIKLAIVAISSIVVATIISSALRGAAPDLGMISVGIAAIAGLAGVELKGKTA